MIFNLFSFMEVQILPLFLVVTSFVIVGFQISIFSRTQQAIIPESFNSLGCLDLILRGGGH